MKSSLLSSENIVHFWFGDEPALAIHDQHYAKLWWTKNGATDQHIREQFELTLLDASEGKFKNWEASASSLLALILLTDQFPRNIYRGTAQSFAYDHLALDWSLTGIKAGKDKELLPIHRIFWYLPLEHSESIEHQDLCVNLVARLTAEVYDEDIPIFENFLDYAEKHRDIIRRFGRFPHRNVILSRNSTVAEIDFLKTPGSSF